MGRVITLPAKSSRDPHIEGMRKPALRKFKLKRVRLPAEQERYRLYATEELDRFPPVKWLIDKYLAAQELTAIFGKGDTYKSFIALDWSATLANKGHNVVYIAAEGMSGMRARITAWKKSNGVGQLPSL